MTPTRSLLHLERIESSNGYTIIQDSQFRIPSSFNYSLHIIDLNQIIQILTELHTNINHLPTYLNAPLITDFIKLEDKLLTLKTNQHSIKKRGVFNIVGTFSKWLTGTMDEEDREIINYHFNITDTNNHHLIKNMNEQIKINFNFQNSLQIIKSIIKLDREKIQEYIKNRTDDSILRITSHVV